MKVSPLKPVLLVLGCFVAAVAFLYLSLLPGLTSVHNPPYDDLSNRVRAHLIQELLPIYRQAYPDKELPDFGTLLHEHLLSPSMALPHSDEHDLPKQFPKWPPGRQDVWLIQHAGFVLLPQAAKGSGHQGIAVFLKPRYAADERIAVAFNDGTAKMLPVAQVKQMLKTQTGKTMAQLVAESERIEPSRHRGG